MFTVKVPDFGCNQLVVESVIAAEDCSLIVDVDEVVRKRG